MIRRVLVLISVAATAVGLLAGVGPANAAGAPTDTARVALPSPVPAYLDRSRDLGPAPASTSITFRLYLAGRDPAGETRFATAVSTPGSPTYGHHLTPAQFTARFGPSPTQVSRLTGWARSTGLRVTRVTSDWMAITGSAPDVSRALGTTIDAFGGAGDGDVGYAPVRGASLPSSVRPAVTSAVGLDAILYQQGASDRRAPTSPTPRRTRATASTPATASCSTWWGQHRATIPATAGQTTAPTAVCGYTPQQLRSAYGVRPDDGERTTIAVVLDGALPTMEQDADRFSAAHGLAGFAPGQYREDRAADFAATCGSYADVPEEPLDVETAHVIAPAAKIVYVAASCSDDASKQQLGFLDAETRIVDRHLADVETDSFSIREDAYSGGMIAAWSQVLERGAAEGIGFDFDSGDNGDLTDGGFGAPAVLFPASDPWATAVGGTTLEIGRNGSTTRELAWGDDVALLDAAGTSYVTTPPGAFAEGSTGGRSSLFPEPTFQRAVVPERLAAGPDGVAHRVVPDIAADASPMTGWLIGFSDGGTYSEVREGGTSGSSPIAAAVQAAAQSRSGHAVGYADPALYALAAARPSALHDVTASTPGDLAVAPETDCFAATGPAPEGSCVVTLGLDSSLTATAGYDDATGLGAVAPTTAADLAALTAGRH